MTSNRFDEIAKLFANRKLSHRQALATGGAGLAAGLAASGTSTAQEATPEVRVAPAGSGAATLFVQSFRNGSIAPRADDPNRYTVTLREGLGQTIHFTDRPERTVGATPTETFLKALGFLPDNPPNAALVTQGEAGEDEVVVLELLNPTYDEAAGSITYGATILAEYAGDGLAHVASQQQATMLPETFGRASLFIDDCSDIPGCELYGGRSAYVVGPLPDGINSGQCWSWSDFACNPCNGWSRDQFNNACNTVYTECNNRCFVELG